MSGKPFVKSIAVAIGLGAIVASSAIAAQGNPPAVTKDQGDRDDSRMVCRNLVMSGTRLSSRHCRTQAEWDRQERQTQDETLRQRTGPTALPDLSAPR